MNKIDSFATMIQAACQKAAYTPCIKDLALELNAAFQAWGC